MSIPEHIYRWVFGEEVKYQEISTQVLDEWRKLSPGFKPEEYSFNREDRSLSSALFKLGSDYLPKGYHPNAPGIKIADSSLRLPDARSARMDSINLVGVDYKLYLLFHNIAIILMMYKDFDFPGVTIKTKESFSIEDITRKIYDQLSRAVRGNISCISEGELSNEETFNFVNELTLLSELFIVFHEIGHLYNASSHSKHSLLFGLINQSNSNMTEENKKENWDNEILADKFAVNILKIYTAGVRFR